MARPRKAAAAVEVEAPPARVTRRKRATAVESADQEESNLLIGEMLENLNGRNSTTRTFRLSDSGLSIHIPGVIPTGSEWLDNATGRGGIPMSRISMIAGDEGTGKTTLGLQLCASIQRMGGVAAYIDAEYKLDVDYARALGVDVDRLLLSQPDHMEGALETITKITEVASRHGSKRPILIVLDSLNTLPPEAELEGNDSPGQSARTISKGLRKIVKLLSDQRVALVMISQLRDKIGIMFGGGKTTGGGKGPRFYSAVLIEMAVIAGIKEGGTRVGNRVKVKVQKNQIAAPFRKAEFVIRYGGGIDWVHSLHETLIATGVVSPLTQGRVTYGDLKWQGPKGLRALLEEGEAGIELARKLVTAVREQYGWADSYSDDAIRALLNAGAPFAVRAGLSADDEDEGDDEDDDSEEVED